MPAYTIPIPRRRCSEPGCNKPADHEVRNGRNEVVRCCCRVHANMLVRQLNGEGLEPSKPTTPKWGGG